MALDQTLISKKFIYALLISILGFVFVVLGKVTANDWFSFVQIIGGMYVIGNIAEKVVNKPVVPEPLG
jgi:hypothetical protein